MTQGLQGGIDSLVGLQTTHHIAGHAVGIESLSRKVFDAETHAHAVIVLKQCSSAFLIFIDPCTAWQRCHIPATPRDITIDICFLSFREITIGVDGVFFIVNLLVIARIYDRSVATRSAAKACSGRLKRVERV